MHMSMYNLKVVDVIDQSDGSAIVNLDIPEEAKKFIMETYGWKRWSAKKFQKLFIEALRKSLDLKEQND